MYHNIQDFLNDWKYESDCTLRLFRNLTDESLTKVVHPKVRTLGFLAWHITHTIQEMGERVGLNVDLKKQETYNGETAMELVAMYEHAAKSTAGEIERNWINETLTQEDNMYGEMWKRGTTLSVLIHHQAHHRGELVVLMRMNDLPVFGVYGPAAEEWVAYGMEPHK
jgi:uncharacterized damage-inducible protein DinB